ncbi:BrnT family toxin [candidate division KSB1 bacterium]|nr:BrnT family toxin [candidate division KSB1 bacterium]
MKRISWNIDKNIRLKKNRNIGFEDVLYFMEKNSVIDDIEYPNKERYPNQRMFVIDIREYIYLVPYVETTEEIFIKTIIPSRKATKNYLRGKNV